MSEKRIVKYHEQHFVLNIIILITKYLLSKKKRKLGNRFEVWYSYY